MCIYIFVGVNFDALEQGNAYKPKKEPINYRETCGIELMTSRRRPHRKLPVILHVRLMPLKYVQNTISMTCPRLHWKTDNPSKRRRYQFQHSCVLILNCALALAINTFVGFNFDAQAQGNAFKPTEEPKNYRGPTGIELIWMTVKVLYLKEKGVCFSSIEIIHE